MRRLLQLVIPCVLLSGCFGPGEGVEVPQDQIYFPVGLALSKDSQHLFVVSSDFDLQYNGGAVQSVALGRESRTDGESPVGLFDLLQRRCATDADCEPPASDDKVADAKGDLLKDCDTTLNLCVDKSATVPTPCQQGDRADSDRLLFPGRCNPIDPSAAAPQGQPKLLTDHVKIGAFATDEIIRDRPNALDPITGQVLLDSKTHQPYPIGHDTQDPQRLFVPVRGDSTLHWLEVHHDGTFECGQAKNGGACDDAHRAGNDAATNTRGLQLNAEPFAIDADVRGDSIVVTNQTTGTASLFENNLWDTDGPQLSFALASNNIPSSPVGIAAIPAATRARRVDSGRRQVRQLHDGVSQLGPSPGRVVRSGLVFSDPKRPYRRRRRRGNRRQLGRQRLARHRDRQYRA